MKKIVFTFPLIIIIIFLFHQKAIPQNFTRVNDIIALEKKLVEHSQSIQTIVSDFIQEKHLAFIDEVIISNGKFWLKDETSIRWEYYKPFSHVIVIHDEEFKTRDDKGRISSFNVNSNPVFKEVNNLIISSARGDLVADKNFDVVAYESSDRYLLKLTPKIKEIKQVINETKIYFDKADLFVVSVVMVESDDDYTVINFKNRKFNVPVQDDIFILN